MSKQFEAVTIPKWGIEMTHGKIVEWRYREGDSVKSGDELVDIETDKIVNSFEARESGTLAKILVPDGDDLPVGTLIGVIALAPHSSEQLDAFIASHASADTGTKTTEKAAEVEPAAAEGAEAGGSAEVKISPALLRKLNKAGINPETVSGSGPNGRILKEDVDRALTQGGGEDHSSAGHALTPAQQRVATTLSKAQTTVPIYHVRREIAVGDALARLQAELPGVSGGLTIVLVRAIATALEAHPALNTQFDADVLMPVDGGNVALAVARNDGAVAAPVLANAGGSGAAGLSETLTELVERARQGRLEANDMRPAAITLSNLGMYGVDDFTAMVTPPQVMVLSVGKVRVAPIWDEASASFKPEQRLMLTLGCDHRVVNGAQAAQFLNSMAQAIEAP